VNWPWRSSESEGVLLRALWFPMSVLSWFYRLGTKAHLAGYERGWKKARRVDARVVSVGSLVAGGSGKTPMASWLAERLHRRGHKVALLSRGYRGEPEELVTIVSDGNRVYAGAKHAGDEPVVLAGQVAGVPVIVSKDRGLAALRAIALYCAEVLILDDGFQHHRLHRDLDLLTFDGAFGVGNGSVLPRGPLREPLASLERADAIIEIDGDLSQELSMEISRTASLAVRWSGRRVPVGLRDLNGSVTVSPEVLRGMRVGMIAGIAHPDSLRRTLESLGAVVVSQRTFRDHHRYRRADLRGLSEEAAIWITTEKDAGKILEGWTGGVDVRVLSIRVSMTEGEAFVQWVEGELGLDVVR